MTPSVRTFGKYLLDEEIARGGMSRVHLGRLRGLGGFEKRLVVKQVLPELASDPRFVSMFVQEAKTLVQMSHPHIVPVFELGVVDGVYFLAMEYVEGATLAQILQQGALAPELVAHLGAEICDALHYAHERFGVVHRDVTPRNVIVDHEGHSRLLDFGIAAPADDESKELFGTPGYLSPEQLEGEASPSSDIFSLGAALFEALAGRQAFPATTVEQSRAALEAPGPRFGDASEVPPALRAIVLRALERDPGQRFETARELGRALRGFLATHSPEGVAPELGACAILAESQVQRMREARGDDSTEDGPPESGGQVRTLAANRDFEQLMSESELPPPMPAAPADDDEPVGTRPIEGRRSLTPVEPDEPARDEPEEAEPEGAEPEEAEPEEAEPEEAEPEEAEPEEAEPEEADDRLELGEPTKSSAPGEVPDELEGEEDGPSTRAIAGRRGRADERPSRRGLWFGLASLVVVAAGGYAALTGPGESPDRGGTTPTQTPPPIEDAGAPVTPDAGPPTAPPDAGSSMDSGTPEPETGPEAPAARATLVVTAAPWAEVHLDGRPVGNTPIRSLSVRAGSHTIELRNEYLAAPVRRRIELGPGQTVSVFANLEAENPSIQVRSR